MGCFAMKHQLGIFIIFLFASFCCSFVSADARVDYNPGVKSDTVFVTYRPDPDGPLKYTYIVGDYDPASVDGDTVCDCDRLVSWLRVRPMALSTNMLYDCLLVPNIGIRTSFAGRYTVAADWMATWLNDSRHHYYRIYGGDLDLSYRIGGADRTTNPFAGHHIGVYASIVYYDLQRGVSHRGVMSAKYNYAAGLSYTWSLPVARRFNIDFSIGIGYMWGKFKRHTPIDDHDVWLSTHRRSWFGPTRASVSLVWLIGSDTYNSKKGDDRR